MQNSCLVATHAKQLSQGRVLSSCRLSTCWTLPVPMELLRLGRGTMAHPQCTNMRNCWDLQVSASPAWHLCLAWPNARKHTVSCKSQKPSGHVCNITYASKEGLANVGAALRWRLLCLISKSLAAPSLQFSFLQLACFCHALKARAESVPTARNVVIPSCFSFAYLKGSSPSYWAINRKTPWLHLWLLLCRSNITAAVIALCVWSLREKEKSETKAAGSRVLKESRNLSTLQPADLCLWQVKQVSLHQVKGGEEKDY